MDDALPDRSVKKLRLDPKVLADVVAIMSRDGRRTIVKLDDHRLDNPADATAAELNAASEVDVSSFWVNPERPHFGRRHFVYLLSGPAGTQYFGDSVSPEVTRVLEALDDYFGNVAPSATADGSTRPAGPALPAWWPKGWLFETPERTVSALGLATLLVAVLAFLAGRWSVDTESELYRPVALPPRPVEAVPADVTPATTTNAPDEATLK